MLIHYSLNIAFIFCSSSQSPTSGSTSYPSANKNFLSTTPSASSDEYSLPASKRMRLNETTPVRSQSAPAESPMAKSRKAIVQPNEETLLSLSRNLSVMAVARLNDFWSMTDYSGAKFGLSDLISTISTEDKIRIQARCLSCGKYIHLNVVEQRTLSIKNYRYHASRHVWHTHGSEGLKHLKSAPIDTQLKISSFFRKMGESTSATDAVGHEEELNFEEIFEEMSSGYQVEGVNKKSQNECQPSTSANNGLVTNVQHVSFPISFDSSIGEIRETLDNIGGIVDSGDMSSCHYESLDNPSEN